jgi:DNA-directed RNA polymerase subunit M/transcription elongation factor TFIIS
MTMRKITDPELFRNNIRNKLETIIPDVKYCKNLEIGIYNYSLKESVLRKVVKKWDNPFFVQIYCDRLKSIYTNLPHILEQIKDGQIIEEIISAKVLAFMTHQEMYPDKWHDMIALKMLRDKNKFETIMAAATDTFTCRKCHSNKCTYYQQQVRSADEPMTTFVSCIECGCRWKC